MIVTARPSRTIAGKLLTVSDSAIALDTTSGSAEVPRADVLRITQRRRKSLKRSILIGVGIGAGAGAIVGSTARCGPKDFICFGRAFAVPVLAAGGAITGAIYGTVLGLSLHKQVELYAAP